MSEIERADQAGTRAVSSPAPPRAWQFAIAFVALTLAAAIIALIFASGLRLGMDHKTAFGPESEQNEIAIALSETVYGLNLGYIGFATVHDKLVEIWNGGLDGHDPKLLENCSDRDLLNKAITEASSLGPQTVGYVGDGTLVTAVYDDLGYVDLTKLSFALFGRHIEAIYYMFFVLLSISAGVFIITFGFRVDALAVLLCALLAFVIEMRTAIFFDGMPTVVGMRHSSTLALIPMWHFLFLVVHRRRLSLVTGACALIQLAILVLAMRIRGSAAWTVLLVIAVVFLMIFITWLRQEARPRLIMKSVHSVTWWPAALMLGGVLANNMYMNEVLHPIYFTDDVMPYHGLWHSAVLGFDYELKLYSSPEAREATDGDSRGYYEALHYLDQVHFLPLPPSPDDAPLGYTSPWTNTYKTRLHDNITRRVFFAAVAHHPFLIGKLYLRDKPKAIYSVIRLIFEKTETLNWLYWLLSTGVITGLFLSFGSRSLLDYWPIGALGVGALAFAALPNLWAYSGFHAIADLFLTLLTIMALAVAFAFHAILSGIQWLLRSRMTRASWRFPVGGSG
jgi:hypothetical protein